MAVIKGGFEIVKRAMLKELMKRGDDGIMLTLPKNELVDLNARITMDRLIKAGIDPESLTSPDQVLNVLENINNQMMKNARVISADSAEGKTITDKLFGKKGEVVEFPQKRTFKEEIEAMKKSGDIVDKDNMVISEKITDREMFKNSNLNKRDSVTETISYIKTLEPMDAMKEANSVIGRKGKYKNLTPEESQRILKETDDHIFERDIPDEDFAKGGRAGYAVGNQVTPQVDARMNLDYNTLVDQNTAQAATQAQNRKPFKQNFLDRVGYTQHMNEDRMLKDANIENQLMNRMGGLNVTQANPAFGLQNPLGPGIGMTMLGGAAGAYQGIQSLAGALGLGPKQSLGEMVKDTYENTMGPTILANPEQLEMYNKALNRPTDAATPTPDAGASSGPTGYTNLRKFYNPFEGSTPMTKEEYENKSGYAPPFSRYVGYSPSEFYPSYYLDAVGPKTQEGYDSMLADLKNYTLDFGNNPYNTDLDTYSMYQNALDDEGNPVGKFTNQEARDEYDEKKAFRQSRYNLGKSQLDNYFNNLASGGRAGYYTGGMVDVEPNLSDIGHGSDALMARTRLVAPDSQATTSTGLNYLLAEDNDNIRVPFSDAGFVDEALAHYNKYLNMRKARPPKKRYKEIPFTKFFEEFSKENRAEGGRIGFAGGGMGRRAFLKLLASIGGGVAAAKSGILGLGKGGGKKAVTETVKQAAGSGTPPPYFFKLVEKIKTLGDDVTPSYAVKDKENVTKYKDYTLTEDVTTGEQTIQRMKIDDDLKYDASEYFGKPVGEDVYMNYRPGKGQMDETMQGKTPPDEYIEDTSLIRTDKPAKGEIQETFNGVPDDVLKEVEAGSGNVPESFYTGPNPIKKADGGLAAMLGE